MILTLFLASISFIPFWSILFIGIGSFFSWFYSAPPIRLSYRGVGEFPHFIAGLMNTACGYLILTGTIDLKLIIFAIPLSLHLLNVILLFEIPDREADIHGGKTNFIVNHGRKNSFLLITILFCTTSIYFFSLAIIGWYSALINFYLITLLSLIPSLISTILYVKKHYEQTIATKSAIKTAISLFLFSISMILYFIILQI
jgi:1,4-dihydroxy-2-naphthoate octaprenyltransferase